MSRGPGPTSTTRPSRGLASSEPRFQERAEHHRRARRRRLGWGGVALLVVAALAWLVGWSPVLVVRHVRVEGLPSAEAAAVRDLAGVPLGVPLARVDLHQTRDRVRQRLTVAEASVSRSWPSTLVITAVPRVPVLALKNPQGHVEVVDVTGVAFQRVATPPKGLPVVSASTPAGASRPAVRAALSLVAALPHDLAVRVSAITVDSPNNVRFRLGATTVVWGGEAQAERKVAILRALLATRPRLVDVSAPDTPVTR